MTSEPFVTQLDFVFDRLYVAVFFVCVSVIYYDFIHNFIVLSLVLESCYAKCVFYSHYHGHACLSHRYYPWPSALSRFYIYCLLHVDGWLQESWLYVYTKKTIRQFINVNTPELNWKRIRHIYVANFGMWYKKYKQLDTVFVSKCPIRSFIVSVFIEEI